MRQRGITIVEVVLTLAIVLIGMLGMFRALTAAIVGSSSAQRMTQAQARLQQVTEAIRSAPANVLTCLSTTAVPNWAQCEALCRTTLGPAASSDTCIFYTLQAANQATDRTRQQYAVVSDPNDARRRTTQVLLTGLTGRVYDVLVTVGWNDNGTASPPEHRITMRSAVFQ